MPGYISLHRDIQKNWLYEDKRVFSKYEAWIDILMRVNHTEGKTMHNGTLETILRGSTIWSMGDMEKHWKWSNSKVRAFLKRLENDEMLHVKSTTKKTYLTVVNYDFYQDNKKEEAPPKHHQSTTETPTKHTNNNVNNKRPLKPSSPKRVYDEQSFEYRLANYLYTSILKFKPDLSQPNLQTWADDMRKLIELNKRDPKEIGQVIDWVTKDDFWQVNILSASKLRNKWDAVTARMNKSNFKPTNKQQPNLQVVPITDEERKELRNAYNKQLERNGISPAVNI